MTEIEVSLPDKADYADIADAVVECARNVGLECRQDGELKKYPGSRHWHFAKPGLKGTLEVTLWRKSNRLWLSAHENRNTEWLPESFRTLKTLLEKRIHPENTAIRKVEISENED